MPAVVAACSFDRRVTIHHLGAMPPALAPKVALPGYTGSPEATLKRAPRWLRRPVGVAFGFGGKLLTFGAPARTRELVSAGTGFDVAVVTLGSLNDAASAQLDADTRFIVAAFFKRNVACLQLLAVFFFECSLVGKEHLKALLHSKHCSAHAAFASA
jgi:hypothetical protein